MKLLIVINPTSGGITKEAWISGLAEYFKEGPHSYEWFEMQGDGDAGSLQYYMTHLRPDRVVAVGGDGTLKFVAEQLLYSGIPVAFLPAGSANGMATELNLPADIPAALKLAVEGAPRKMDVVRINGDHISLHLSDLGLNAHLIKYFEQDGKRGMWGYAREVLKVLTRKERISLTLEANGKTIQREAWMVAIANARLYGTGAAINPCGSVFDGKFEVVLLKRLSFIQIIKLMLRQRKLDPDKVETISVTKMKIRTTKPVHFQVDGEYICECSEVEAVIEKGAVEMVVGNE